MIMMMMLMMRAMWGLTVDDSGNDGDDRGGVMVVGDNKYNNAFDGHHDLNNAKRFF